MGTYYALDRDAIDFLYIYYQNDTHKCIGIASNVERSSKLKMYTIDKQLITIFNFVRIHIVYENDLQ